MTKLPVFHPDLEQPEDVTDSEWGRLQELPAQAFEREMRRQSDEALAELERSKLEKPQAHDR